MFSSLGDEPCAALQDAADEQRRALKLLAGCKFLSFFSKRPGYAKAGGGGEVGLKVGHEQFG